MIDSTQVYFWTTIRKNRSKYNLTRGISEDDVTNILLHDVVEEKDVQKAETSLLRIPGLRKFHSALKSDREKEDFRRHMRKYIYIWLSDCPFEVSTTNRYTIVTHEAAVIARREIKKGETVKYLVGNLVAMTTDEEKDLDLTRRDFSIVMSSRRRTPSLFLGPARFANHDCDANARLVTQGSEGMQVVAARDIQVDEEITVTYGDNYFGEGNCECLCLTCEKTGRGSWAGAGAGAGPCSILLSDEEEENPRSRSLRRSTRKRSRLSELSNSPSPQTKIDNPRKRRKTKPTGDEAMGRLPGVAAQYTDFIGRGSLRVNKKRARSDEEGMAGNPGDEERFTRKRTKIETSKPCISLKGKERRSKMPGSLKVMGYHTPDQKPPPPIKTSLPVSPVADSMFDELSAALKKKPLKAQANATEKIVDPKATPDKSTGAVKVIELMPPIPDSGDRSSSQGGDRPIETPRSSDYDSLFSNSNAQVSSPATTPGPSQEPDLDSKPVSQLNLDRSDSDLSELDPDVELDNDSMTVIEKSPKRKRAPRGSKILPTIEIEDASLRIPGDYTRTPLLLGEKYSRWVDCRTCSGCWVQQNGYQTRKECPRCERHSKLYGYRWPKTAKIGEDDEEERVMDHRTVHRFIPPGDERLTIKRGKGCIRAGSESTTRTNSIPAEIDKRPVSKLRESARIRKGSRLKVAD